MRNFKNQKSNGTVATFIRQPKLATYFLLLIASMFLLNSCQKETIEEMDAAMEESHRTITAIGTSDLYTELTPELLEKAKEEFEQVIQEKSMSFEIETTPFQKILDAQKQQNNNLSESPPFATKGNQAIAEARNNDFPTHYHITSNIAGHNLDVVYGRLSDNNPIWQYTPNNTGAQMWRFIRTTSGYYYIESKLSGKYLTPKNGSSAARTPIVQLAYTPSLAHAQQWKLYHMEGGYFYIKNRKTGLMLDIKGGSNKNGAILWQYPYNATKAQQFKIKTAKTEKVRFSKRYGGNGGAWFHLLPEGGLFYVKKISRIYIRHGKYIDGIFVEWELTNGQKVWSKRAGGGGGKGTMITLGHSEYITKVEGRAGKYVDQLTFYTNTGRRFGPHGENGGVKFSINVPEGVKGFNGKAGKFVDKIGVVY